MGAFSRKIPLNVRVEAIGYAPDIWWLAKIGEYTVVGGTCGTSSRAAVWQAMIQLGLREVEVQELFEMAESGETNV